MRDQELHAIGWMVLHSVLFTLIAVFTRFLLGDLPIVMIFFCHSCLASIVLLPFALKRRAHFRRNTLHLHVARGVLATFSMLLYIYVLSQLPLADVTAFSLIGPIIVSLFALVFFKEHITRYQIIALMLGVLGALLIIRPGFEAFNMAFAIMFVVLLLWSTVGMILKLLGRTESSFVQLYFLNVISTIVVFPFAWIEWQLPSTLDIWAKIIGLTFVYIINGVAVYNAFRLGRVAVIMPFVYIQVLLSALWGYVFFDEPLNIYTAIGAAIIVWANVLAAKKRG